MCAEREELPQGMPESQVWGVTAKGDREEVPREIGGKARGSKFLETMGGCFNKK